MEIKKIKGFPVNFLPRETRENLESGEDIKVSLGKLQKIIGDLGLDTVDDINVEAHNADPKAHPSIRTAISDIKDRIIAIEIANGIDVTANPFAVTFGSLDGIEASGVWNQAEARIEF